MLLSFLNPTCKFWKWLLLLTVQLAADPDPNVKNGAELLDRLIKVSNMTVSLLNNSRVLSLLYVEIHYFHIDHYAPYLPRLPPPPKKKRKKKKLHDLCFQFFLGITVVPREIQDNGYAKFFFFCENGKLRKMIFQSVTLAARKKKSKYRKNSCISLTHE